MFSYPFCSVQNKCIGTVQVNLLVAQKFKGVQANNGLPVDLECSEEEKEEE